MGWVEQTLPITAYKEPDFSSDTFSIPHPRYENLKPLQFKHLTADAVKKDIALITDWLDPVIHGGAALVVANLPSYGNSAYADVRFENVKAFKAGKPVAFQSYTESVEVETFTARFWMTTKPGKAPVYDQVTGQLVVRYSLQVVTHKIRRSDPPTVGVQFRSDYAIAQAPTANAIRLSLAFGNDNSVVDVVRAYDAEGRPLRRETSFDFAEDNSSRYNYWGKVDYVEVDEVTEWATIVVPFKLAPAKK